MIFFSSPTSCVAQSVSKVRHLRNHIWQVKKTHNNEILMFIWFAWKPGPGFLANNERSYLVRLLVLWAKTDLEYKSAGILQIRGGLVWPSERLANNRFKESNPIMHKSCQSGHVMFAAATWRKYSRPCFSTSVTNELTSALFQVKTMSDQLYLSKNFNNSHLPAIEKNNKKY